MSGTRITGTTSDFLPDVRLGFENLRAHKLRSLLTMLGMIFGVAAVIAMLSIGAGAQQEVIAFIEQLGVRNVIVEAREAPDQQTLQRIRQLSPGLSFKDYRAIRGTLEGVELASARKRVVPSQVLPKPQAEPPAVFGIEPAYQAIANLRTTAGRFFTEEENTGAVPVAVLGQAAAASLFGSDNPVGQHVKLNDQWFEVIGVAGPQMAARQEVEGIPAIDHSIGRVSWRSISSGDSDGAVALICTCTGVVSGNASSGRRSAESTPAVAIASQASTTTSRLRRDHSSR